ncbi:hypothetical protein L210DRAFT_3634426 [Boletus edulis BED1]|uniref:Uncharacterized protein n=1 Tax=Boletus edulis BED1 TaxID=1328754 RepID=A0AAD4BGR9_BOLED|nr:hypothetical protein L210DRAFT_3634426 [Boletus edulis BED1]
MGGWGPSVRRGTLGGLSTCLLVRRAPLSEDWGRATGPLRACFSSKPVMIPYLNNRYTDLLVVFGQVGNVAVYPSRLSSTCHRDAGILVGDSGGQGRTDYTAAMVEGELERQTERSDVQLIRATIALVENITRLTTQVQGVKKRYLGSNCMLLDRWFYYHEIGAHGSCACTSDLYILTPLHDVGAVDEGSHRWWLQRTPVTAAGTGTGICDGPSHHAGPDDVQEATFAIIQVPDQMGEECKLIVWDCLDGIVPCVTCEILAFRARPDADPSRRREERQISGLIRKLVG